MARSVGSAFQMRKSVKSFLGRCHIILNLNGETEAIAKASVEAFQWARVFWF